MGSPISTGAAIVGSAIAGSQQQKKVKTANKNQKRELYGLLGDMNSTLESGLAEQHANILQGNKASLKGFDEVERDADRLEGQGIQASKDFFNQAMSGANARASGQGLLGSSIQQNMRTGGARIASRIYSDAQIAASRLRTSAKLGRAGAEAENFGRLGSFAAYRANQKNALFSRYFDFVAGQQHVATPPDFSGVAQLLSSFKKGGGGGYNEGSGGL